MSARNQLPDAPTPVAWLDKETTLPLFFFSPWPNHTIGYLYLTAQHRIALAGGEGGLRERALRPRPSLLSWDSHVNVYWGSRGDTLGNPPTA